MPYDKPATRRGQARSKARAMGPFKGRSAIRNARRTARLSAQQAATARGALSDIKTPMGAGQVVLGAGPVTGNANVQVTRAIPAGSTFWVAGLNPADTLDNVVIDGINVFQNGALAAALVDPTVFHAVGVLITSEITQSIAWQVTSALGALTATGTLVAPSVEVEDILDAADDACAC